MCSQFFLKRIGFSSLQVVTSSPIYNRFLRTWNVTFVYVVKNMNLVVRKMVPGGGGLVQRHFTISYVWWWFFCYPFSKFLRFYRICMCIMHSISLSYWGSMYKVHPVSMGDGIMVKFPIFLTPLLKHLFLVMLVYYD